MSDAGDMFVIKTPELVCSRLFTLSQVSYHHNEYLLRMFSQNTHYPPQSSPPPHLITTKDFCFGDFRKKLCLIFIFVDRHEISLEGKDKIMIIFIGLI